MHHRRRRDASGALEDYTLPLFDCGIEEEIMLIDDPLVDKLKGQMHQLCRAMGFVPVEGGGERIRQKNRKVITVWPNVAKRMLT